jgi:hypothetical protein
MEQKGAKHDPPRQDHRRPPHYPAGCCGGDCCGVGDEKGDEIMKHHGNICKINGAEVEPFPILVTMYHFKEEQNGK